jgi:hypothetical protein
MKLHLIILAGSDNRRQYIVDTIRVCEPHFDFVKLFDTGATDNTITAILDAPSEKRLYQFVAPGPNMWHRAYQAAFDSVPVGDWFLFLDSDERPSRPMLDEIRGQVEYLEKIGGLGALYPNVLHFDGIAIEAPDRDPHTIISSFPKNEAEFETRQVWTKRLLVKKCGHVAVSSNGAHAGFSGGRTAYFPTWYNHIKTGSQLAKSTVYCSWERLDTYSVPKGCGEWQQHEKMRQATGLLTPASLENAIQKNAVTKGMMDLWAGWQHSQYGTLREYYRFAHVYGFKTELAGTCGKVCCRYNGGIQL